MTRTSWTDLKNKKLGAMTPEERAEYDRAYAEAQLSVASFQSAVLATRCPHPSR